MKREILRVEHLSKRDGEQTLLRSVTFSLYQGEQAALICNLQERRCLSALLSGRISPDAGCILLDDRKLTLSNPQEVRQAGLYCLDEHTQMIPNMTVGRNFALYQTHKSNLSLVQDKKIQDEVDRLLSDFGLSNISSSCLVSDLSNFDTRLLEMIRFTSLGAKLLLLDNVCADISATDCARLREFLNLLRKKGVSILLLAHKYSPLFEGCNSLILLRGGVSTWVLPQREISRENMLLHLSTYSPLPKEPASHSEETLFSAKELRFPGGSKPLTFSLDAGKVLGLWDIDRKYSAYLGDVFSGKTPYSGELILAGKPLRPQNVRQAIQTGVALSSCLQHPDPIYPELDLWENVTLLAGHKICGCLGLINPRLQKHLTNYALGLIHAEDLIQRYGKKPNLRGVSQIDQMRIIIAKWLCVQPHLFVFISPFTVLDDVTIHSFQQVLQNLCELKIAVLISSINREFLEFTCDRTLPVE